MNTLLSGLAALSLLIVVSSCGSEDAANAPSSAEPASTTGVSSDSDVDSVRLKRTGGLKPVTIKRVFSVDARPPKGYSASDVTRVIGAAQAFIASSVDVTPTPGSPCCDSYLYQVTVTLADGSAESYQIVEGLKQPDGFQNLLRLLE